MRFCNPPAKGKLAPASQNCGLNRGWGRVQLPSSLPTNSGILETPPHIGVSRRSSPVREALENCSVPPEFSAAREIVGPRVCSQTASKVIRCNGLRDGLAKDSSQHRVVALAWRISSSDWPKACISFLKNFTVSNLGRLTSAKDFCQTYRQSQASGVDGASGYFPAMTKPSTRHRVSE